MWRPMIGQVKSARQHTLTILAIVLSVLGAMMMLTFLIAAMGYSEPKNGEPPMEPGPGWPFVVAYSGVVILIAAVVCFRIGRHR